MILSNEEFHKRCEEIRKEIEKEKGYLKFNENNPPGLTYTKGKIEGLEYCYNIIKSI